MKSNHSSTVAQKIPSHRVPGVSECLKKGVLPRQHQQIRQFMTVLAKNTDESNRDQLHNISKSLIEKAKAVNETHQRMKESAEIIKEETAVLKDQLALFGTEKMKEIVANVSHDNSYSPIGDGLQ